MALQGQFTGRSVTPTEDERDYRLASESWEYHIRKKTRLYTREEQKRELGLSG
jgi:hypothetical protein